ncbi:MAG: response regulator [Sneathiellaceae bacterium]
MTGGEIYPHWKVLVVDDEPSNLSLMRSILQDHVDLCFARSGPAALEAVVRHQPDLILLDVMMPDMDGHEVCRRLKADPATAAIPVIFVTAMIDEGDEEAGFGVGAVDYLHKPVVRNLVLARTKTHLALAHQQKATARQVFERTQELQQAQNDAIHMLGRAGHFNDTDTGLHIWRMADYARALAQAAGWPVAQANDLMQAAPMHDMGKIGIPDAILKKPGSLDPAEWEIMRTHCEIGHGILSVGRSPLFHLAAEIALSHHEKWDGSGYPAGLKGEAIPESARIVAIADVFDALTMQRPYKPPWNVDRALAVLREGSGAHFDPRLTALFIENLPEVLRIKQHWDRQEQDEGSQEGMFSAAAG